jgi:ribosomal-protein-alanine N-acetyltransferase
MAGPICNFCFTIEQRLWKIGTESAIAPSQGQLRDLNDDVRSARYNGAVSIVIREFRPEDFETLWRMDQECFPPGISYSKRELKTYIRSQGAFTLVATEAATGEAMGFIVGYAGPTGHIVTIDVSPRIRRAGVGSLLIDAAEDRMRVAGARAVGLETAVDNLSALRFYKKHGYVVVRTWPRYYSNGVDALVMKKDLVASSA